MSPDAHHRIVLRANDHVADAARGFVDRHLEERHVVDPADRRQGVTHVDLLVSTVITDGAEVVTMEKFKVTDVPIDKQILPTSRPFNSVFGTDDNIVDVPRNVTIISRQQLSDIAISSVLRIRLCAPSAAMRYCALTCSTVPVFAFVIVATTPLSFCSNLVSSVSKRSSACACRSATIATGTHA